MKRLLKILTVCVLLLMLQMPGTVHSAEVCSVAQEVSEPCEGVLVPTEEAREALKCFADRERALSLLILEGELHNERIRLMQGLIDIENKRAEGLNLALIEATAPDPWYESPILWFSAGAATVLVIVLATR